MDSGTQQTVRTLKKGELLFAEGEKSRAMYLLKSGAIRLFLKKGTSNIEIDTIRPGQILGELAFLDGNPRSVSGEALMPCELVEISGPMFIEVLNNTPGWLKALLKTVVSRLRAANTRIRQLEAANVALDYSDTGGKRSSSYQYLSSMDCTKVSMALLLVGSRNGVKTPDGIDVDLGLVNRFANHTMGVPLAKIVSVVDILVHSDLAKTTEEKGNPRVYLKDLSFLAQVIEFLDEESRLDAAKKHDLSVRGFFIMGLIVKYLGQIKDLDPTQELVTIDIGPLREVEVSTGKEPFRTEEVGELVKFEYVSELKIKSATQIFISLKPIEFVKAYRLIQVLMCLREVNEQKRSVGKG